MTNRFSNQLSDAEYFELLCQRIQVAALNIAHSYDEYLTFCFICCEFGDAGRQWFHLLSSVDPKYDEKKADEKFNNCLQSTHHKWTIGTLVDICKQHGIDTSKPRGRHAKSDEEKAQEQKKLMDMAYSHLRNMAHWRFNTWLTRPEILEPDSTWRPVVDRDLSTYYIRLKEAGVKVSANDVTHIIFSRDFTTDYNPFRSYGEELPKWKEGDTDYIREFFIGHMEFGDPENVEFYDQMFHKWFIGMVGLWLGYVNENPLMPVLYGPQHVGKTFFVRHILPPQLASYLMSVNPAARVDKDFEISMSETPLMFLDEFNVSNLSKSEAYKYAITSSSSYLRDSYGHFREMRDRKASLIAATNHEKFIMESEGDRRYLAVNLVDTVNLNDHPLPYEGAYAQALWLLENGFDPKPTREESELISEHNMPYLMPNDCEEALRTFIRIPSELDNAEAYSAGDLLRELNQRGFSGRGFKTVAIGRAMKNMGFESKKVRGTFKYNVVLADFDRQKRERIDDAIPEDEKPF